VFCLAAAASAAAHVPVIAPHLDDAPYMGVLFVLLTSACAHFAGLALRFDTRLLYACAATVCGLAVAGYAATRLVPFPKLADDVGDWLEPLGVLAITAEAAVVVSALIALRAREPWNCVDGGTTDKGRSLAGRGETRSADS
jgi:hypothetical protein